MKKIICIQIIALLFSINHVNAFYIKVTRTVTNGGANGYANLWGNDMPVYGPDGKIDHINQTIHCWDPGSTSCPSIVTRPSGGIDVIEGVEDPALSAYLIAFTNRVVSYMNNGILNGTESSTLCVHKNGAIVCYHISVSWTRVYTETNHWVDEIHISCN